MVLDTIIAKAKALVTRESVEAPGQMLGQSYAAGLPVTGTTLKIKILKGSGSCNHITIEVYTASDNILRATRVYHLDELKEVLDLEDASAEQRVLTQIRSVVLQNADQPLSVIKAAVEGATYRI